MKKKSSYLPGKLVPLASSAAPNEGSSSSVPRSVFVCLNFLVKKGPLQNKILIPFLLHFLKATGLSMTADMIVSPNKGTSFTQH